MAIAYYFQSYFCRFRCRGNSNKSWGQSVQAASKAPFAGANISKAVKKTIIIQIKLIENEKNRFKADCHCLRIRHSQRSEYSCRAQNSERASISSHQCSRTGRSPNGRAPCGERVWKYVKIW